MPEMGFKGISLSDQPLVWIQPVLINSWVNYEATWNARNAAYAKDERTGIVYMRGLIRTGTINTIAFYLPPGYRPPINHLDLRFAVVSNSAFGQLTVNASTGSVTPETGNSAWFSLTCCFATNL
jgi:hypothetical protein